MGGLSLRRHRVDLLGSDQEVGVAVEPEVARDVRPRAVGSDHEPGTHRPRTVGADDEDTVVVPPGVARAEADPDPGVGRGACRVDVEAAHVTDAVLVPPADERHRAAPAGRVQHDASDRRPEAVGREREVVERPPDEDAGGADRTGQAGTALDEQDVVSSSGQLGRRVQPGEPGTDDEDVDVGHVAARAAE